MHSNDKVSVAVEIDKKSANEKHLIRLHEELPRIFCDFPLLGTNDFSFPVVVNSPLFNPTEPRDGIPLIQSERSGGDSDENRNRISEAIALYNTMLDYLSSKGYRDLYNIVKISEQSEKYWLDSNWVEQALVQPIKEHIRTTTFIHNSLDEVCSLYDVWGTSSIFIMKDETPEHRRKVWELSNRLMPAMMTRKNEIEHWYNSLWVECRNFGIIDLIKEVEGCGDLETLSNRLGCDSIKWLNDLIILLYHNSSKFIVELGRNPAILPNQCGDFLPLDKIYAENNIGETYKDIAFAIEAEYENVDISGRNVFVIKLKNSNKALSMNFTKDLGSQEAFVKNLVLACFNLQARKHYSDANEDERNDYIGDILGAIGYTIKDQTRRGSSSSGKDSGELDIFVSKDGLPFTVIEAMNLDSLSTSNINKHLDKIFSLLDRKDNS